MQHGKNTKVIEQIGKLATSADRLTQSISEVIDKFNMKSMFKEADIAKRCGITLSTVGISLILLPFVGAASVFALFKSGLNNLDSGKKDVYYDMKNNSKINWRSLLSSMGKRFQYLVNQDTEEGLKANKEISKIKAMIFDDSSLEKAGKHIEGVGFIHDHVKNTYILGFKLLVCGFWDGVSFIPIDFSLHKEKRDKSLKKAETRLLNKKERLKKIRSKTRTLKQQQQTALSLFIQAKKTHQLNGSKTNKKAIEQKQRAVERIDNRFKKISNELETQKTQHQFLENDYLELKANYRYCGLKESEYKDQFKKSRDRSCAGSKRFKESNSSKIDVVIKMLKGAVRKGFVPSYVITDTWFFSRRILQEVIAIGQGIHLLSMAKIGNARYNILPKGKLLNPNEIVARYERTESKYSRKYKANYIPFQAEYQGIRVKIFLIRLGIHGKWRMLVTSDIKISFTEIMEVYKIRWTIEVFFKECKQHLLLGKCQSQDFDAQIAETTISLMRYTLLSYYERIHYGTTIGGLFKELSQAAVEENLLADIRIYFFELLQIFAEFAGVDFMSFYEDLSRKPEMCQMIFKIGLTKVINNDITKAA